MNAAQIHLALNHAPLFFSVIGGLLLLYGFIRKNDSLKTVSLYFMIAAALLTVPVYLTGEGTEEKVEGLAGVSESMIHEHEEMAETGLVIIIITGFAAIVSLLIKSRRSLLKASLVLCVILSFVSFGVMAQTAHLGGQIRHSEISGTSAIAGDNENAGNKSEQKDKRQKDDDD